MGRIGEAQKHADPVPDPDPQHTGIYKGMNSLWPSIPGMLLLELGGHVAQAACLLLNGLLGAGVLGLGGSVLLLTLPDKGRLLEEPAIRREKELMR
jgi:hypothetical protein